MVKGQVSPGNWKPDKSDPPGKGLCPLEAQAFEAAYCGIQLVAEQEPGTLALAALMETLPKLTNP